MKFRIRIFKWIYFRLFEDGSGRAYKSSRWYDLADFTKRLSIEEIKES